MTPDQAGDTEILAISIDGQDEQRMTLERIAEDDGRAFDFPLLSDPEHSVIDRYGLLNQQDPRQRPIPHPTVFVVDREGVVRWKFIEINYKVRPENPDILAALDEVRRGR